MWLMPLLLSQTSSLWYKVKYKTLYDNANTILSVRLDQSDAVSGRHTSAKSAWKSQRNIVPDMSDARRRQLTD